MEPFLGEIQMVAFNFAPRGWALCDGQVLPIAQNQALFAILGTTYGGDGNVSFALPNLNGRSPVGPGQGPGLSAVALGQQRGEETVALTPQHLPPHSHALAAVAGLATTSAPSGRGWATAAEPAFGAPAAGVTLAADTLTSVGEGTPIENRQPQQVLTFIIAITGIFPQRD